MVRFDFYPFIATSLNSLCLKYGLALWLSTWGMYTTGGTWPFSRGIQKTPPQPLSWLRHYDTIHPVMSQRNLSSGWSPYLKNKQLPPDTIGQWRQERKQRKVKPHCFLIDILVTTKMLWLRNMPTTGMSIILSWWGLLVHLISISFCFQQLRRRPRRTSRMW